MTGRFLSVRFLVGLGGWALARRGRWAGAAAIDSLLSASMGVPADRARSPIPDDEGEDWLYWSPPTQSWHRVELVSVPSDRARRVRVQHLDSRANAEWVPVGRLRVPWDEREAYLARELKWGRVQLYGEQRPMRDAAWDVLMATLSPDVADLYGGGAGGVLEIGDLEKLSSACGLPVSTIIEDVDSFQEDGYWYVPWTTTLAVVCGLARRNARTIIEIVMKRDGELRAGIIADVEGYLPYAYMSDAEQADFVAELTAKRVARGADLRRALLGWAEFDAPLLAEEYITLRRHLNELTAAIIEAIPQIESQRTAKASGLAQRLREAASATAPTD